MFCFNHVDEDHSLPSTPRGTKKKHAAANSKNPYASRGLEKYNSVLTELEAKKEKIMAANSGSDDGDVPMVRFMYSKSQDWVPIVVRVREENNGSPLSPRKDGPPGLGSAQSKLKVEMLNPSGLPSPKTKVRKHVTWSEGEESCAVKYA